MAVNLRARCVARSFRRAAAFIGVTGGIALSSMLVSDSLAQRSAPGVPLDSAVAASIYGGCAVAEGGLVTACDEIHNPFGDGDNKGTGLHTGVYKEDDPNTGGKTTSGTCLCGGTYSKVTGTTCDTPD